MEDHRFELGGALLSALILEAMNNTKQTPLFGLLFGASRVRAVERVSDEDELRSASERVTTALRFATARAPLFDAAGAADAAAVASAAAGATVVGLWVSRPGFGPTPSLRDAAALGSLRAALDAPHLVLFGVSVAAADASVSYRCVAARPGSRDLRVVPAVVRSLEHDSRADYALFDGAALDDGDAPAPEVDVAAAPAARAFAAARGRLDALVGEVGDLEAEVVALERENADLEASLDERDAARGAEREREAEAARAAAAREREAEEARVAAAQARDAAAQALVAAEQARLDAAPPELLVPAAVAADVDLLTLADGPAPPPPALDLLDLPAVLPPPAPDLLDLAAPPPPGASDLAAPPEPAPPPPALDLLSPEVPS